MKLKLLAVFAMLCVALHVDAQSKSWMLFNNGQAFNPQNIVQLPDASVVSLGINSWNYNDTTYYNQSNLVLSRITPDGNVLWAKQLNALSSMYAYGSGLFYANNFIYVLYTDYDTLTGATNTVMLKMDQNGALVTSKKSLSSSYTYGADRFAQLPNGNIVLMKSVSENFQVVCLDQNLDELWAKSVTPDPDNSKNPGLGIDVRDEDSTIVISGKSDNRLAFVSLTSNGDYQFGFRFDEATKYMQARNVFRLNDGIVMVGLYSDYTTGYSTQSFICKSDLNGNMLWFKIINDANSASYDFTINYAAMTPQGGFIFSGNTAVGSRAIGELDANGNVLWSRIANGSVQYYTYDIGSGFAFDGMNVVLLNTETQYPYGTVCRLTTTDYNTLTTSEVCGLVESQVTSAEGSLDYALFAIPPAYVADLSMNFIAANVTLQDVSSTFTATQACETSTGIAATSDAFAFDVSPNPATDNITVRYNGEGTLKIYNAVGALVVEQPLINNTANVAVSEFASGMYLVSITNGTDVLSKRFIVKR